MSHFRGGKQQPDYIPKSIKRIIITRTDIFIQQNLLLIVLKLKQNYSHQAILVIDI